MYCLQIVFTAVAAIETLLTALAYLLPFVTKKQVKYDLAGLASVGLMWLAAVSCCYLGGR